MRFRSSRFAGFIVVCSMFGAAAVAVAQTLPLSPRVTRLVAVPADLATTAQYDLSVKLEAPAECTAGQACPVTVTLGNEFAYPAEGPFFVTLTSTAAGSLKFVSPATWSCDGAKDSWACKSPTQSITQSAQSRFTAQLGLPASAENGEISVCGAITWMGSNAAGKDQAARLRVLQSALSVSGVYTDVVDGTTPASLNLGVYAFIQKYGLNADGLQNPATLSQALFGANALVAKDSSLVNDLACAKITVKGGMPPKPKPDFAQASTEAAAIGGALQALQPNFGAPAVAKPASQAPAAPAAKAPEPAKPAAPAAVAAKPATPAPAAPAAKAPAPAKPAAAAPVAAKPATPAQAAPAAKAPAPAKPAAAAPVAAKPATPAPAAKAPAKAAPKKEEAKPAGPKPFFFWDPRKYITEEPTPAAPAKPSAAKPAAVATASAAPKPFFFWDPRHWDAGAVKTAAPAAPKAPEIKCTPFKPTGKKTADVEGWDFLDDVTNASLDGGLDAYIPDLQLSRALPPLSIIQLTMNGDWQYTKLVSNTSSVYDLKLEGEPKNVKIIAFNVLDNTASDAATSVRLIRGNQKPMPQYLRPGQDFTTLYIQGNTPSNSYTVIVPTAGGALSGGNSLLPIDASKLPAFGSGVFSGSVRTSPYVIKVQ